MGKMIKLSSCLRYTLVFGWATVLVSVSHTAASQTSSAPQTPRLVIGITVEGMTEEYIDLLKEYFGDKGFNYILKNGVTFTDIEFGNLMDGAAYNAIIHTGAAPAINGIASENTYNPTARRVVPVLNSSAPSDADENYSPIRILASTLSDEIKIHSDGLGQIHSIAPSASMAITAGGHTPNSTYWINDVSGKWTTSTYYQDRPTFLQYRNRINPVSAKLDTLTWIPTLSISEYPTLSSIKKEFPFMVRFQYGEPDRYIKYKASPIVNDEITEVAIDYIGKFELGKHQEPDMLNIAYTLQPFPYSSSTDEKGELLDGYLRFDRNLSSLFSAVENGPGMENTLFFIVGTPVSYRSRRDDDKWGLPTGEFSPKKAISLLNLYLINKYGNGDWISGYSDGYFYLNETTAFTHGADPAQIRADAAAFLRRMSGVAYSYSIDDIVDGKVNDDIIKSRNIRLDCVGDVFVSVLPGWEINDTENKNSTSRPVQRFGNSTAPAFLLFPYLEKDTITSVVDARAIAPTVASILRIRPPNGASASPVRLKRLETD